MLTRVLLIGLLLMFVGRALWRLIEGIVAGASLPESEHARRGERMVRDPVCGTFVLPSRALSVGSGSQIQYFCSDRCRSAYRDRRENRNVAG